MDSTPRENVALVREFLSEAIAGGDVDALDIFLTDGAVQHQPVLEEDSVPTAMQDTVCRVLGAADVDIAIEHILAEADMVAVRARVTGTHRASPVDVIASGRTFQISYAWFCRIEYGQIAEVWSIPDVLALQRALDPPDAQRAGEESRVE